MREIVLFLMRNTCVEEALHVIRIILIDLDSDRIAIRIRC